MEDDTKDLKWWSIFYVGRSASKEEQGSYIWRLCDELYVKTDSGEESRGYWWLTSNPKIWSFAEIKIGEKKMGYEVYMKNKLLQFI